MPAPKIKALLEREHVPYEILPHAPVYTALETAHATHTPGREFAKVTMLDVDGRAVMAVLPAGRNVDIPRFRELINGKTVVLMPEGTFRKLFPDCEPGAEPPFGELYRMEVYADVDVTANEFIVFNAGTHREVMRIPTREWKRLVRPVIASFAVLPPEGEKTPAWG